MDVEGCDIALFFLGWLVEATAAAAFGVDSIDRGASADPDALRGEVLLAGGVEGLDTFSGIALFGVADAGADPTRFLGDGVPLATGGRVADVVEVPEISTGVVCFFSSNEDLAKGSRAEEGETADVGFGAGTLRAGATFAAGTFFLAAICARISQRMWTCLACRT